MNISVVWKVHFGCKMEHVLEMSAARQGEMVVTGTTVPRPGDKPVGAEAFGHILKLKEVTYLPWLGCSF